MTHSRKFARIWLDEWLSHRLRMTGAHDERSLYLELWIWSDVFGPIQDDVEFVARIAAIPIETASLAWPEVRRHYEPGPVVGTLVRTVGYRSRSRTQKENTLRRKLRMTAARAIATHTDEQWALLVARCGSVCVRCGSDGPLTKDHIVPVSCGGSDGIENLQPLCGRCNASKCASKANYIDAHIALRVGGSA